MMDKLTQELFQLKKQLEHQKTKRSETKGRLDELYSQLKERFNCDSQAEAEEYYQETEQEQQELCAKVEASLQEIRKLLNGN